MLVRSRDSMSVELEPLAFIARLPALVPSPKRDLTCSRFSHGHAAMQRSRPCARGPTPTQATLGEDHNGYTASCARRHLLSACEPGHESGRI